MFTPEIYINRRNKLKKQIKSGLVLFLGNSEIPYNYGANPYGKFRQYSSFLYFFGLNYPDLHGVIDIDNDKEYIFGNDIDIEDIIWTGPQETIKEKAVKVGVNNTAPSKELEKLISNAITKKRKIHFLPQYRANNKIFLSQLIGMPIDELQKNVSAEFINAVVSLRSFKEPYEISELEKAHDILYKVHKYILNTIKPGTYEYEIAGGIEGIIYQNNANLGFPVICSVHGETLHNHSYKNKMKEGDLLLTDTGAETELRYNADITRTYPVSGKFTTKQKDIYDVVLKANEESIKMSKPGVKYRDVNTNAYKTIAEGLKTLGIMKGDSMEAAQKGAVALFMPHGLGHMIGLDAHDMEALGENYVGYDKETKRSDIFGLAYLRLARKLEPGFVITVEPGIYFIPELIRRWKKQNKFAEFINYDKLDDYLNFGGIRIEDNILITDNGCKVIGKNRIPKTTDEIESVMGK
jgi:Xaa-Pro aminopeptidase